jgi:prevent-host-death family protein
MKTKPKVMKASDFKAQCLKVLDELEPEGVLILKRGKPVARVIPVSQTSRLQLIGSMKGRVKIKGDIFTTGAKWRAKS